MVPRLWPGATIVCMATGPSLTAEDAECVRDQARVVAINDAHRLAPWADVLYSSDRLWWRHYKSVQTFAGLKFGIGSAVGKANPFSTHPDVRVLRNTGHDGLETDPAGLRNGRNSGFAAINLAVHLGAARILLLGYDMQTKGDAVHFFGNHQGMMNPTDVHFQMFRRTFPSLVAPLKALGIAVINCTPGSALDTFPMGDLRTVLSVSEALAS